MSDIIDGASADTGNDGTTVLTGGDGGAVNNQGATVDDLPTLFTPEEIEAKREAVKAAKAEEERRAALTDEERAAEDEAKAAEAKKGEVPEEYGEFLLGENFQADKELLAEAIPLFKELGLTQEQAQKVVDLEARIYAKRMESWDNTVTGWSNAAKADTEYGGDKFSENVAVAQRALNSFGTPELRAVLDQYGVGNHPEMIRLMYRIGKSMREDSVVMPGATGERSVDSRIHKFYEKSQMS